MSLLNKKLNRIDGRLAAYATLAGAALAAPAIPNADATIICSGLVNINIPSTTAGIYLNLVSGVFAPLRRWCTWLGCEPVGCSALAFLTLGQQFRGSDDGVVRILPEVRPPLFVIIYRFAHSIDGSLGLRSEVTVSKQLGSTAFNLNS